jgi:hypothetical protein
MIPHCWDIKCKLSTMSNIFVIPSSGNVAVFFLKFVAVHWCRYLFANLEWNFFLLKFRKGNVCLQFSNACWKFPDFWENLKRDSRIIVWGVERSHIFKQVCNIAETLISCVMSVHLFFMKFDIWVFLKNLLRKFVKIWQEWWVICMKMCVHVW